MKKIHSVLVEDDLICREALIKYLVAYEDILMVDHADNGQDALAIIEKKKPDIVLLDYRMERGPGPDGLELIRSVKEILSSIKIITLTGIHNPYILSLALKVGTNSIVLKDEAFRDHYLAETIRKACRGDYCLPQLNGLSHLIYVANEERNNFEKLLNKTQYQAVVLLSEGRNYKEIAAELGKKSPGTIANAVQKVRDIQNIGNNQELVQLFRKLFPK